MSVFNMKDDHSGQKELLLIDLDDTINELKPTWISRYNELYNDNLDYRTTTSYDIVKYVKPECGDKIFDILDEDNFYLNLPIKEDCQEVLEELSNTFNIYIVTSSKLSHIEQKSKWISKYLPMISQRNIITTFNKSLIKGDYLIDDHDGNLDYFEGHKIKMVNDWGTPSDDYFTSNVRNWRDILKLFK